MLVRDLEYFGIAEICNKLFEKSKNKENINHAFKYVISDNNIRSAIKIIASKTRHSKMYGLETFDSLTALHDNELIKIIKTKLQHQKGAVIKEIKIPKSDGTFRVLKISGIVDRIAQQCFLNILSPIVEAQFSDNSFGMRLNSSPKHAFAKVFNVLWKTEDEKIIIEVDFKSLFDNIKVDLVLDKLRHNFNVKDPLLLSSIKRILNSTYLTQGSTLGGLLSNVLLDDLDRKFDSMMEQTAKYDKHLSRYLKAKTWHKHRKSLFHIRYSRYADDMRIITPTFEESVEIMTLIRQWSSEHGLLINEDKTRVYSTVDKNSITMCGFTGTVKDFGSTIRPSDLNKVKANMRSVIRKAKKSQNNSEFVSTFISLMSYYSICTNLQWLIKMVEDHLNPTKRSGNKIENIRINSGSNQRLYKLKTNTSGEYIYFQPWTIRGDTNESISMYLRSPFDKCTYAEYANRMDCSAFIDCLHTEYISKCVMYLPGLLHRQKFKCYVTGKELTPGYVDIHHKVPKSKGGLDNFNNLILLSRDVHQALHGLKDNIKYKHFRNFKVLENKLTNK